MTSFNAYNTLSEYKEFDAAALPDGTTVRTGVHLFFKVSNLGGWVSYTGSIHPNVVFAQIMRERISAIRVYFDGSGNE